MSPTFQPLLPSELEDALDLMQRLYAHFGAPFDRERARRATRALLAHPEHGGVWLIQMASSTVGYVVLTLGFSLEFEGLFGLLDELYLTEPWREKGIGTKAVEFAEDRCRARGARALRLEVDHANPGAKQLYARHGFEVHHRDLMTKWL